MQKTIDSERLTKAGGLNFADKNLSLADEYGYSHIYNRLAKWEDAQESGEIVGKEWHDEQVLQLASENEVLKSERDNLERTLEETGEELKDAQAEIERKTGVIRLLEKDVAELHKERERRVEEVYADFMQDYKIMREELNEITPINKWVYEIHKNAVQHGWYDGNSAKNFGELLMLVVTEVAEVMEEYRNGRLMRETYVNEKGKMCGIPSELADIVIRVMDICGYYEIDLEQAIAEKHEYNKSRPYKHGGKKC